MIYVSFIIPGRNPDHAAPPPTIYREAVRRFAQTYKAHPAGHPHTLILMNTNDGLTPEIAADFADVPHILWPYAGTGWDIGAHQLAAKVLSPADWLMCFSSWAWFDRPGWLAAFAKARDVHGDALYGSTASHERRPHIRGTGFFCSAQTFQRYPRLVDSRRESFEFESGIDSLTMQCIHRRQCAYLVTPDGIYDHNNFRTAANVFRRGSQMNLWTRDKHTDIFDRAGMAERVELSARSDGPGHYGGGIEGAFELPSRSRGRYAGLADRGGYSLLPQLAGAF